MSSNDPFNSDHVNPYARPSAGPGPGGQYQPPASGSNPLMVPAIILLVLASLSVLGGIVQIVQVAANGIPEQPNQDAAEAAGFMVGFWGAVILIPVINLLIIAGSIAMMRRSAYPLAMTAAIAAIIPFCGPCVVVGIPFGIWALVLLSKPEVKASFT